MKAYKLEVLVIDHDELGGEAIADTLRNTRYPNWCISPAVRRVQEADIGEWSDDHPLNRLDTAEAEYERLFPQGVVIPREALEKLLQQAIAEEGRQKELAELINAHFQKVENYLTSFTTLMGATRPSTDNKEEG